MAVAGTRTSWYTRFRRVSRLLLHPGLDIIERGSEDESEDEEKDQVIWSEARSTRSSPEAYIFLVDRAMEERETKKDMQKSELQADKDLYPVECRSCERGLKDLQWLPRWCMSAPEAGEENLKEKEFASVGSTGSMLWFGDIPENLADAKQIVEILHRYKPPTMPKPFITKVVKKGYRSSKFLQVPSTEDSTSGSVPSGEDEGSVDQRYGKSPQSSQPPSKPNENREGGNQWKGYAFLVFRDKEEAEEALKLFDGLDAVDYGWTMRVRWADEQHQGQSKKGRKLAARLLAGADPPLGEQLCPSNLRGEELRDALRRHFVATGLVDLDPQEDAWVGFEAIKAFYRKHPRQERHACGIQVPENIRTALLEELRATRWPPVPDRTGMQSEEYLVLHRNKSNDGFGVLMALCESLLQWADPLFSFNRVAVTKDFQGSPHTDSSDTTFQYLMVALHIGSEVTVVEIAFRWHTFAPIQLAACNKRWPITATSAQQGRSAAALRERVAVFDVEFSDGSSLEES